MTMSAMTQQQGLLSGNCSSLALPRPDSPGSPSTRAPSEVGSDASEAQSGLIIFDWDDTLFPTTFVASAKRQLGADGVHSAHGDALELHARLVEDVLRAAAACCRVCIVTLAGSGWVEHSAARYLPGLDLPRLLLELSIQVHYAREFPMEQDCTAMKMAAMSHAISMAYAHSPPSSRLNVVSIGDSSIERTALHELLSMWSASGCLAFEPMQKTLKLLERPGLQTLTAELALLVPHFQGLYAYSGDLDFIASDLVHIQSWMLQGILSGAAVHSGTSIDNVNLIVV